MPTAEFLLNRRETVILDRAGAESEGWNEMDGDELFDDFVVLEAPDFSKYNAPEKLQHERDQ